jgi:histone H1/5
MELANGEPRVTDAPKATTKKASKSVEAAMADRTPEAAAKKAPRPKVELHDHCPLCGYAFPKPKARCRTKAACEKRAAARTAAATPAAAAPKAKKATAKKAALAVVK